MHSLNTTYRFLLIAKKYPDSMLNLIDSVSVGQLQSKQWLIDELTKLNINLGNIFLCAGWYAVLALMLFESKCKVNKIRSFDIDPSCEDIAETINRVYVKDGWKFKAATADIRNITYDNFTYETYRYDKSKLLLTDSADTIINTSCEHIENFDVWYNSIPNGKIVALQTNNYTQVVDHINCSKTLEEFTERTPLTKELFSGQLELENYTRFMRIGYK